MLIQVSRVMPSLEKVHSPVPLPPSLSPSLLLPLPPFIPTTCVSLIHLFSPPPSHSALLTQELMWVPYLPSCQYLRAPSLARQSPTLGSVLIYHGTPPCQLCSACSLLCSAAERKADSSTWLLDPTPSCCPGLGARRASSTSQTYAWRTADEGED